MPEADIPFRAAAALRRWLAGREVTEATSHVPGLVAEPLVGCTVETVETFGKHVLLRFDSGHVLHTHLRMTGSWHVYSVGQEWRRPERQAGLVLTCGDRLAVCFNAPVVELLGPEAQHVHPALMNLGPDVLGIPLDVDEIRRRARANPPDRAVGEVLLDQRVVAGLGNVWRCEALWAERHNPWKAVSELSDEELDSLVDTAGRLMGANVGPSRRSVRHRVYGQAGRPCPRCGTLVEARRQGEHSRTAYWCPGCQPRTR
jgi:endonuclease VIII